MMKCLLIAALSILLCSSATAAQPEVLRGLPLGEALTRLQQAGLPIVFSDRLVEEGMRVLEEPPCGDPRCQLDSILLPWDLRAEQATGGSLVIVRMPRAVDRRRFEVSGRIVSLNGHLPVAGATVSADESESTTSSDGEGRFTLGLPEGIATLRVRHPEFVLEERQLTLDGASVELEIRLQPMPLTHGEVIVRPSHHSLQRSTPVARLAFSRAEIQALPHLGDDLFRTIPLLPGVTSNDISAQFHIRGGRTDEVRTQLAGQELYDPFHLQDFDGAMSVLPAEALGSIDAITGAAPVNYGDRMGGVLHMTFRDAEIKRRFWLGLSVLNLQAGSTGLFDEGRGQWLASLRRGSVDLLDRIFSERHPSFGDLSGRLSYRLTPRHELRFHSLVSRDRLQVDEPTDTGQKLTDTEYDASYFWLTHQGLVNRRLYVDTVLSLTDTARERFGDETEKIQGFRITDNRTLEVADALQAWNMQATDRHFLEWGWQFRHYKSSYDYRQILAFESPITTPEQVLYAYEGILEDNYSSAYLSDQLKPIDAVVLQLGVRYDHHSLTGEDSFSPRIHVAGALSESTTLSLGWGLYRQAQRTYELQVEDRDTRLYPEETTHEIILGVEQVFEKVLGAPLTFGAEIYQRDISNPRARYENLFEPYNTFPEAEPDRHRFDPASTTAKGVSLFARGGAPRIWWWANYTVAQINDLIDGIETPRQTDQRHTFNGVVTYRAGAHWDFSLATILLARRPQDRTGRSQGDRPDSNDSWKAQLALGSAPSTALTSRNSSKPKSPHSRPLPDCL